MFLDGFGAVLLLLLATPHVLRDPPHPVILGWTLQIGLLVR
jgi:hypothetical protein